MTGTITLEDAILSLRIGGPLLAGDHFTILNNDGTDAVIGQFNGLPEGGTFMAGNQTFAISYQGNDGNDVVLTAVVPEPATWLLFSMGTLSLLGAHLGRRATRIATSTQMSGSRPGPQPAGRNRRQNAALFPDKMPPASR